MDDLISRQAAIDALNRIFDRCEEIEAHLPEGDPDRTGYKMYPDYMTVWKYLHQLPSAQTEIIRCKDCKHQIKEWRDDKRLKDKGYWVYGCNVISDLCGYWNWFGQVDEFCSDAERRTDETN